MRHPRDSAFIRRLNAPTRAAAARRRRLRKALVAAFTVVAVLIALMPGRSGGSTHQGHTAAALRGRHVLSLPADAGLVSALTPHTRVTVWNRRGKPLVTDAPVVLPGDRGSPMGGAGTETHTVLVAVRDDEVSRLSGSRTSVPGDAPELTITISP